MARLKDRLAQAAESGTDADALLREGRERLAYVPTENIEPDPDQPRTTIGDLEDLKASIGEHGIIQPIVISPHGAEMFRIIAGERRYSAAKELGLKTVPAIIRTVEAHRRLEVQLIENIHRKELSPVEEADAYRRLIEEFQLSQRQLAKRLGKSVSAVNETLRILSLPQPILESVRTSEHMSRSVLLEIAKQDDEELRDAMWQSALAGNLTVKTARRHKPAEAASAPSKPRTAIPFKTRDATVTVVFPHDQATPADVVAALSQALKEARLTLRDSGATADPVAPDNPSD